MEQVTDPNFLYMAAAEGFEKSFLINLSLVRMVGDMKDGQCTLYFSENHKVTLHGAAADELTAVLLQRTILADGTPFKPHLMAAFKRQSPD